VKLADLLRDVPVREVRGDAAIDITSVTADSRLVTKGALFAAIPGTVKDGTAFIPHSRSSPRTSMAVPRTSSRSLV